MGNRRGWREALAGGKEVYLRSVRVEKGSVELSPGRGLFLPHAPGDDLGPKIVFAAHRSPGKTPEHGDLPDVGQRVGHRSLEQLSGWRSERIGRRQVSVEGGQGGEETLDFAVPRERIGLVKLLLAFRDRQRPVEQVADVGEDAAGRAAPFGGTEIRETGWCAAHRLSAAIGERGYGMTKK